MEINKIYNENCIDTMAKNARWICWFNCGKSTNKTRPDYKIENRKAVNGKKT